MIRLPPEPTPSKNVAMEKPAAALAAAGFGPCVNAGPNAKDVEVSDWIWLLRMRRISAPNFSVWLPAFFVKLPCQVWVSMPKWMMLGAPSALKPAGEISGSTSTCTWRA
jgi:hypothetical protein